MKKHVLFLIALLIAAPLAAQPAYVGLYADQSHDYYAFCPAAGFYKIDMWIWFLPGQNGQMCAEFSIEYPTNTVQGEVTANDEIVSVYLGDLPTGIAVCYKRCQFDWHWIYRQEVWVTDPLPGILTVGPHYDIGVYQIANCSPGYPLEPCVSLADLYYNDPCPPGGP